MRRAVFICLILLAARTPARAQSCEEDSIASISRDGAVIVMTSGAVFEIDTDDQIDVLSWAPEDSVRICHGHVILDEDEGNARASASRVQ